MLFSLTTHRANKRRKRVGFALFSLASKRRSKSSGEESKADHELVKAARDSKNPRHRKDTDEKNLASPILKANISTETPKVKQSSDKK